MIDSSVITLYWVGPLCLFYSMPENNLKVGFLSLSGTPGQLLSAEPVGLTWVGSSQPLRRTCLRLAFGVWPARLCFPVSPRARERVTRGGTACVSSACDFAATFPCKNLSSVDPRALYGCSYFKQSAHHTPPVTPGSKSIVLAERSGSLWVVP